jgi:hypothetical protein
MIKENKNVHCVKYEFLEQNSENLTKAFGNLHLHFGDDLFICPSCPKNSSYNDRA